MLNNAAVDKVFHALAEPTRRAMVERLSRGPLSVSDLAQPFGVTLAAVMQHLAVLEESGLVHSQKVGRVRTCRVEPKGLSVVEQWLSDQRGLWERRLDRLGALLDEEDEANGSAQAPSPNRNKKRRKS